MLKTICYISDSQKWDSLNDIKTLYLKAKANNFKNNITGILIYEKDNFLQVLEGQEKIVDHTFKKICQDSRHKNVFEIINITIEERIFEDYNFGFTIIDNKNGVKNLTEYLEWLKNADDILANKVISLVENFIVR